MGAHGSGRNTKNKEVEDQAEIIKIKQTGNEASQEEVMP